MLFYVITMIVVAALAAFIILLARKIGAIEWVQVHGNDFFAQMFSCDFCLSWWVGVILSIIFAIATREPSVLLVPVCSTVITRKML